jgi:hypothetical protein
MALCEFAHGFSASVKSFRKVLASMQSAAVQTKSAERGVQIDASWTLQRRNLKGADNLKRT